MSTIHLEFVSQDHLVFSGDVYEVIAPGIEGQMAILPKHAPLITILTPDEITVRRQGQEDLHFAVSGGWMEVLPTEITILARTAERAEDINVQRAEEARARAEQLLAEGVPAAERSNIEIALRRSQIRMKVARRRSSRPVPPDHGLGPDQE